MKEINYEVYKETFRKMWRIGMLHRTIFEKNISDMGIHHSQHHLLMYIAKEGEVSSQKVLAEKFCISPAAIARTLKELEVEGYIEKSSIENDCRCNKIIITEKGKAIVSATHKLFKKTDEISFADFSEEDLQKFNDYLDKMQSRLHEENKDCCCVRKTNEKE